MSDFSINNQLTISGTIASLPIFYHEAYDEKFYTFELSVNRLSEAKDIVPILISEKILPNMNVGDIFTVNGQLRTYNKYEGNKRRLVMFAFVRDITKINEEEFSKIKNTNELIIKGNLCKKPSFRVTPLGREVSDILVAVNRAYRKSDYIPAISWGRNAKYCSNLETGTYVQINGRFQSRTYTKRSMEDNTEVKVAYEVSINRIKEITEEEYNTPE